MREHFSSHMLAEVFRDLFLGERSGVLHLSRGEIEKKIYFDRGMILFAESPYEEEDLGPRLVAEGKISPGALAEARRNISESKDLAQALINRDLIAKDALAHTVRYVVERIVRSVFQWEGGSSRFSEGWLLQEIFESDILFSFEIILKAISTMVGFEPIGNALKNLDNALVLRQPPPVPVEMLALTPSHGFALSRIDSQTSFRDVIAILPPAETDQSARFLYGLVVMGVVNFKPRLADGPFKVANILREHADKIALEQLQERTIREAYEKLRDKNPFEVLEIAPDAPREEIERAYEEAKSVFTRDRFLPRVRDRLRRQLAFVESRLVESYLALIQNQQRGSELRSAESRTSADSDADVRGSDLAMRPEMDKSASRIALEANSKAADAYIAKARKAMREGDFHSAIQFGKLAISYNPGDAKYYGVLADCQVRNPDARWQRMAEQNYLRAIEIDPWNADYLIGLGRLYKKGGLRLRARKQFEKALEIAPSHDTAQKELGSLA